MNGTGFFTLAAAGLALALAACGPLADEPIPGEPASPLGPSEAGGQPHPLAIDDAPRWR